MLSKTPRVRVRTYDRIRHGGHEVVCKHTRRFPRPRGHKPE
ncbi:hypothetical protein [Caulobacter soli]|nr:hypothetical protein [Caulobacter soli]